ncbi:hypothetical protein WJX84_003299 [Apatococcus fuscideae]|uniref:Uncharacterized protein n=1 Tax=Apatococcus fuscideae TaxID=2026836 RepID=A0AAW1RR62_9CHLO
MRLDDYLTKAQQDKRAAQQPIAQQLRGMPGNYNPHFVRDILYIWEGRERRPYAGSQVSRQLGRSDLGGGRRGQSAHSSGPTGVNATPIHAAGHAQQAGGSGSGGQPGGPSTEPQIPGLGASGLAPSRYDPVTYPAITRT